MKEFILDYHTSYCDIQSQKGGLYSDFCKNNIEKDLFFIGSQFIIIGYFKCNCNGNKYEFLQDLLKRIIDKNSVFKEYKIERSVSVDEELREFRIRNKALRKVIQQAHYVYYDNAMKKYAITSKTDFVEAICNQDIINENYKEAKQFLIDNDYTNLLRDLDTLFEINYIGVSHAEVCKTTDHLIKEINKLINQNNGNNQKSKL